MWDVPCPQKILRKMAEGTLPTPMKSCQGSKVLT